MLEQLELNNVADRHIEFIPTHRHKKTGGEQKGAQQNHTWAVMDNPYHIDVPDTPTKRASQ